MVGTADSTLIREVSFIERFHCITKCPRSPIAFCHAYLQDQDKEVRVKETLVRALVSARCRKQ